MNNLICVQLFMYSRPAFVHYEHHKLSDWHVVWRTHNFRIRRVLDGNNSNASIISSKYRRLCRRMRMWCLRSKALGLKPIFGKKSLAPGVAA